MTYTFRPWHIFPFLLVLFTIYSGYLAFNGHFLCEWGDLVCPEGHKWVNGTQIVSPIILGGIFVHYILESDWSYTIKVPTLGFKTKSKQLDSNDEVILELTSNMIKAHNEGRYGDEELLFNRIQEREQQKLRL